MHFFIILLILSSKLSAAGFLPPEHKEEEKENLILISYSTKMLLQGTWGCGSTVNPLGIHATETPILYALIKRPLDSKNLEELRDVLSGWTAKDLQEECQIANPVIRESPTKFQCALDNLRKDLETIHTFLVKKNVKKTA